jgi:hypothetical protein
MALSTSGAPAGERPAWIKKGEKYVFVSSTGSNKVTILAFDAGNASWVKVRTARGTVTWVNLAAHPIVQPVDQ